MNPRRLIPFAAFCAAAAIPAFAGSGHYPITRDQIAASVTGAGLEVTANDVSLLADVVATVRRPALKMTSVQPAPGHLLIAHMECSDAAQCLPFMVALRVDGSASQLAGIETGSRTQRSMAPLVHTGSTATLLLDGPHIHISLVVICLENGALGQTIRAANPDRSQFYTVQVAGDRLLKGRL